MKPQKKTRAYNSQIRRKQAEDTKNRIADVAEKLIHNKGYENTTIGAIAEMAGVANQTVYSIFGSKQGILLYLIQRASHSSRKTNVEKDFVGIDDSDGFTARLVELSLKRNEAQSTMLNSLGGFEMLYPELCAMSAEHGNYRREILKEGLSYYKNKLKKSFPNEQDMEKRLDLLWSLTDGSLYYLLVQKCGWTRELFLKVMHQIMNCGMTSIDFGEIKKRVKKRQPESE